MKFKVQIYGINTWHEYPPKHKNYPFTDKDRAINYAKYLAFGYFEKKNPTRIIDSSGDVVRVCYPYFNRL